MATAGSELKELTDEYERNQEIIKTLKKLLKVFHDHAIEVYNYGLVNHIEHIKLLPIC